MTRLRPASAPQANAETNPNDEIQTRTVLEERSLDIRASSFLRHPSFIIRHFRRS
jgi:hypothetical protein